MASERWVDRLGAFLRGRRLVRGWKMDYVARVAGLDKGYVSRIERGLSWGERDRPPLETLMGLARAYEVELAELEGLVGGRPAPAVGAVSVQEYLERAALVAPIAVPVVEHPAHAGHEGSDVREYVYVDRQFAVKRDLLCLPVEGECMAPWMASGDLVLVDRNISPRHGRVVVAVVEERVLVRRYVETNGYVVLRAVAAGFDDVLLDGVDVIGVVVEVRRRVPEVGLGW